MQTGGASDYFQKKKCSIEAAPTDHNSDFQGALFNQGKSSGAKWSSSLFNTTNQQNAANSVPEARKRQVKGIRNLDDLIGGRYEEESSEMLPLTSDGTMIPLN